MSNNKKNGTLGTLASAFSGIGAAITGSSTNSQATSQQQASALAQTASQITITGNPHISPGSMYISAGGGGGAGWAQTATYTIQYDKTMLKHFKDEDIEQEYLRRFSPLMKALREENE